VCGSYLRGSIGFSLSGVAGRAGCWGRVRPGGGLSPGVAQGDGQRCSRGCVGQPRRHASTAVGTGQVAVHGVTAMRTRHVMGEACEGRIYGVPHGWSPPLVRSFGWATDTVRVVSGAEGALKDGCSAGSTDLELALVHARADCASRVHARLIAADRRDASGKWARSCARLRMFDPQEEGSLRFGLGHTRHSRRGSSVIAGRL
jgi:hypothetical protein